MASLPLHGSHLAAPSYMAPHHCRLSRLRNNSRVRKLPKHTSGSVWHQVQGQGRDWARLSGAKQDGWRLSMRWRLGQEASRSWTEGRYPVSSLMQSLRADCYPSVCSLLQYHLSLHSASISPQSPLCFSLTSVSTLLQSHLNLQSPSVSPQSPVSFSLTPVCRS